MYVSYPVLGRELPLDLQKKVGPLPDGFLQYFTSRWALQCIIHQSAPAWKCVFACSIF